MIRRSVAFTARTTLVLGLSVSSGAMSVKKPVVSDLTASREAVVQRVDVGERRYLLLDRRPTPVKPTASNYYVAFVARPAGPMISAAGHAFVLWGTEDSHLRQSYQTAYGLYQKEGLGIISDVPAALVNDATDKESLKHATRFVVVRVSEKQYRSTLAMRKDFNEIQDYRVAIKDCVTFVDGIARAIGIKVPERGLNTAFPVDYLDKMIDLNRDKRVTEPIPAPEGRVLPLKEVTPAKGVHESAVRQMKNALALIEQYPEQHYDLVVHSSGGVVVAITLRATRLRAGDPGLVRGDESCIYWESSDDAVISQRSAVDVVQQIVALAQGVESTLPVEPAEWRTLVASDNTCPPVDSGSGIDAQVDGGRVVRHVGIAIRPSRIDVGGGAASDLGAMNLQFGAGNAYPDLTPKEQVWRRHRDRVQYAKALHDQVVERHDAALPNGERARVNTERVAIHSQGAESFNLRQRIRLRRDGWAVHQRSRYAAIREEVKRRADQVRPALQKLMNGNNELAGILVRSDAQFRASGDLIATWATGGLKFSAFDAGFANPNDPSDPPNDRQSARPGDAVGAVGFDGPVSCDQGGMVFAPGGGSIQSASLPCVSVKQ